MDQREARAQNAALARSSLMLALAARPAVLESTAIREPRQGVWIAKPAPFSLPGIAHHVYFAQTTQLRPREASL